MNKRMNKLLVVVDMQNDFINGALENPEAEKIVDRVCDKIRGWGGEIAATLDTHRDDYHETLESKSVPIHCIMDTDGWHINQKVKECLLEHGYSSFVKNTYGSLELADTTYWYDEIVVIGICTDICVLSNAVLLRAANPDIPISVDSSCCAGTTVENHHNALKALKMIGIEIR